MEKSHSTPFIEPIFKGDRFTGSQPNLPIEVLPEIIAYQEIIKAIAKELYFSANKNRSRLPRGFQDHFKLSLTDIKTGSVIPVLSREFDFEQIENDEYDQARDLLNEFIIAIEKGTSPPNFPSKVIPLFENFGKTLKPGETIELRVKEASISPTYSKEVRSTILTINKKPYLDVCYLIGSITGFDAEKRKLFILLEDGQAIEGPLDTSFDSLLRELASNYKIKDVSVTLIGLAKYNADGSVNEIKKLQHLVVFQDGVPVFFPNINKQLEGLDQLKNGWLDNTGDTFLVSDLDLVQTWLENLLQTGDMPSPFIYPSENSVIECEWSFGYWEISFSFLMPIKMIVLHAAHVNSEEIREDRINLQDNESIEKALRFLKSTLTSIHE